MTMLIGWALLTGFIAPWFFMLARLKNMGYTADIAGVKALKKEFGWLVCGLVLTGAVIGVVSDALFNIGVGLWDFRELPRWDKKEFLFTGRVKRWSDDADAVLDAGNTGELIRAESKGLLWRNRLNKIMPGHV